MLRRSTPKDTPRDVRREAQKQAVQALQYWLDMEAGAGRSSGDSPGRVGPWPFANIVMGACVTASGVMYATTTGSDGSAFLFLAISGLLLSGAGIGTLVERLRQRNRLSMLARGAALATAQAPGEPEILARDLPEPPLPDAIARPLARARSACAGIARIAGDPAWTRYQVPVKEHEVSARAQLQALEEWAQRLAMIDGLLAPAGGSGEVPPHLQELAGIYEEHSKRLLAAAEVFERAQASLARALLALTTGPQRAGAPDTAMREIGAAFDSLAQVLESLGRTPEPAALGQPSEDALRMSQAVAGRLPGR